MVMLVSLRIEPRFATNRALTALTLSLLAGVLSVGPTFEAYAQQDPQRRPQQQQKPPASKPKPQQGATTAPKSEKSFAAKTEGLPPSQVGIGTLARHAFMVDPQTSTVLLFKDAEVPMVPSSMADRKSVV